MAEQSIIRVGRELMSMQKAADNGSELSLAVAFKERDVREVRALIIGPPDTPYEFGFFEFSLHFGKNYPQVAPKVKILTTNRGRTRFGPNLYAMGRVCLSILGTWRGESGEEWSSAQGLESVLLSIQSLMSANPYENEPGFEKDSDEHPLFLPGTSYETCAKKYAAKIRHETLRVSVIERLEGCFMPKTAELKVNTTSITGADSSGTDLTSDEEGPAKKRVKVDEEKKLKPQEVVHIQDPIADASEAEPFTDLYKRRFQWYYASYVQSIEKEKKEHRADVQDGKQFPQTVFEHKGNNIEGKYDYSGLTKRLHAIYKSLEEETSKWEEEGKAAMADGGTLTHSLKWEFDHIAADFKRVDLEKVDDNPYVWRLNIFGRPMTNLEGGLFRVKVTFSPRFPKEQPRVKLETSLFHYRVSPTGDLCYFPVKPGEVRSHIEAILKVFEDDSPSFDPRAFVNPEAAALLWGTPEERKIYNRRLRKSASESSE